MKTIILLAAGTALVLLPSSRGALAEEQLNINACLTAQHFRPGMVEFNPGLGAERMWTFPQYAFNAITPYAAAGAALCRDSYYELAQDGRKYDDHIPNRLYLNLDAGGQFVFDPLNIGIGLRLAAADYRRDRHMLWLPHIGEFAIVPAPNIRLSYDSRLSVFVPTVSESIFRHVYLDITPAITPFKPNDGFIAFKIGWSFQSN
jgi:hypothetical protein